MRSDGDRSTAETPAWEVRLATSAPGSARSYRRARSLLAGGTTHVSRNLPPFPISVARASGSRKWDLDGNQYIDYAMGHGAHLLGHLHPIVADAVRGQMMRGTHYGSSHETEVEWAAHVVGLMPSADVVRFTSSGTEAIMLGARVARCHTGRSVIVKLDHHFHGWSEVGLASSGSGDTDPLPGVTPGALRDIVSVPANDPDAVSCRLAEGDVAAVVVEPSGARFGELPMDRSFLAFLVGETRRRGALLIFDEVVTGFRWSPGGAQEKYHVRPDLTALGKILGGGLPAGALAGRRDVMSVFESQSKPAWTRSRHLHHPGTFNGNALSAAAGIATLELVATGDPTARADALADDLRRGMNDALIEAGIPGVVFGESSVFHVTMGDPAHKPPASSRSLGDPMRDLRVGMLSNGVDLIATGGFVSAAHRPADIEATCVAFSATIRELALSGALPDL